MNTVALRAEALEDRFCLSAVMPGVFREGAWYGDAGNRGFEGEQAVQFGLPGDKALSGDLNGDGRDELIIYRQGNWYIDWENNGFTGEGVALRFGGFQGDTPLVGDVNGDGRDEIIIYRQGSWFIDWENNGYTGEQASLQFGGFAEDQPVLGDLNGDRRDEIMIYRQGAWFIDLQNNGYNGEQASFHFGGFHQDKALAADFNGDGRDEIAVFRNGAWFLDWENNGYTGEGVSFNFGLAGDTPVTGNFGAEFVARVSAYRPLSSPGVNLRVSNAYWNPNDTSRPAHVTVHVTNPEREQADFKLRVYWANNLSAPNSWQYAGQKIFSINQSNPGGFKGIPFNRNEIRANDLNSRYLVSIVDPDNHTRETSESDNRMVYDTWTRSVFYI